MICRICNTELPNDAVCCYRCGTFITDGGIRQVEPLSQVENEQTTVVRPVHRKEAVSARKLEDNKTFGGFLKLSVLALLLACGVLAVINYQKQWGGDLSENYVSVTNAPESPKPPAKLPQSSTPVNKSNSNFKMPVPIPEDVRQLPPVKNSVNQMPGTPVSSDLENNNPVNENNGETAQSEKLTMTLNPGKFWFRPIFISESKAFSGRFRAKGGSGNDVEVYILDPDGFENFRNGNSARTYYNSGRKTVESFNVTLPTGNYYLVVSNTFSIISTKNVSLTIY